MEKKREGGVRRKVIKDPINRYTWYPMYSKDIRDLYAWVEKEEKMPTVLPGDLE